MMFIEKKFKKGMKVKVNNKSNDVYSITNSKCGFVGEIIEVGRYRAIVKVIKHKNKSVIGREYNLSYRYLEPITEKAKTKVIDIEILLKGNQTKAIIDNKVGIAKRNPEVDEYDKSFGILLSVARALKMNKDFIDSLIDLYFDGEKEIKDFTSEELLEELKSRI